MYIVCISITMRMRVESPFNVQNGEWWLYLLFGLILSLPIAGTAKLKYHSIIRIRTRQYYKMKSPNLETNRVFVPVGVWCFCIMFTHYNHFCTHTPTFAIHPFKLVCFEAPTKWNYTVLKYTSAMNDKESKMRGRNKKRRKKNTLKF